MARKMSQQTTAGARTSTQKGAELPFWGQAGCICKQALAREGKLSYRPRTTVTLTPPRETT